MTSRPHRLDSDPCMSRGMQGLSRYLILPFITVITASNIPCVTS